MKANKPIQPIKRTSRSEAQFINKHPLPSKDEPQLDQKPHLHHYKLVHRPKQNITQSQSLSNLLANHNYIKINPNDAKKYETMINKSHRQKNSSGALSRNWSKTEINLRAEPTTQPTEIQPNKQPRFMRKKTNNNSPKALSAIADDDSLTKIREDYEKMKVLVQEKERRIEELERMLAGQQTKNSRETMMKQERKLQELTKQIFEKDRKIKHLAFNLQVKEQENRQLNKKLQSLFQKEDLFDIFPKTNNQQILDPDFETMVSLASNYDDLQEEVQNKNNQILDLKELIEILLTKNHKLAHRNQYDLRKGDEQYAHKLKKLLHQYRKQTHLQTEHREKSPRLKRPSRADQNNPNQRA